MKNNTAKWNNWLGHPIAVYIMISILCLLFIFGTIGNSFILCIYGKREKNSSRIFIMVLAMIDMTVCILMIPFTIFYIFGVLNDISTVIYNTLMKYLFVLICMIFTSISIDRYFALAKPLVFALDERKAKRVVILNLMATFLIVLIMLLFQYFLPTVFIIYLIVLFIILVIVVTCMYSLAFNALRKRSKKKVGSLEVSTNTKSSLTKTIITTLGTQKQTNLNDTQPKKLNNNNFNKSKSAVKTAKVLLTLTGLFLLSYMPFLFQNFFPDSIKNIIEFLLFFNNVVNILVYLLTSERFRKEFNTLLKSKIKYDN